MQTTHDRVNPKLSFSCPSSCAHLTHCNSRRSQGLYYRAGFSPVYYDSPALHANHATRVLLERSCSRQYLALQLGDGKRYEKSPCARFA